MLRADGPHRDRLHLPEVRRPPHGRARRRCAEEPQRRGVDAALRRPVHDHAVPLRQRRLGQEGVGLPADRRCQHRLHLRGRLQPVPGHPLRGDDRRSGPLDQAVRQQSHRVVQGPRHDGARLRRPADDPRGCGHPCCDMRLDRRHLRRGRRLLRDGGHSRPSSCCRRTRSPRRSSSSRSPTTR